jgi:hypothetical protein
MEFFIWTRCLVARALGLLLDRGEHQPAVEEQQAADVCSPGDGCPCGGRYLLIFGKQTFQRKNEINSNVKEERR